MSSSIPTTLSQSPPDAVARLAESLLPDLGDVRVVFNHTGIAMLPYRDSVKGEIFHLGEVLIAEARVQCALPGGHLLEGYGACLGRDTQHALAMALLDVAWRAGIGTQVIHDFVNQHAAAIRQSDDVLRAKVELTRVAMETF